MPSAPIDLTEDEETGLEQLASATGKPRSELIHIAIHRLLSVARERGGIGTCEEETENGELPFWGIWGHVRGLPEDFHDWRAAEEQTRLLRLSGERS